MDAPMQGARKFIGKGSDAPCPACRSTDGWWGGDGMAYLLMLKQSGESPELEGGGTELLPIFCGNCGYVQLRIPDLTE
jgi:hypothetical protein